MITNAALWQTDPIQYLIRDKYPDIALYLSSPNSKRLENLSTFQAIANANLFKNELNKKNPAEISILVEEAKARESEKFKLEHEKNEASAFFNQTYALANFEYWSKMSYWTIDEALALSLGKNPTIVTWNKVQSYRDYSPFIAKYTANRELVLRAKVMGQIWDNTIPNMFVLWAERMRFELPIELVSNVKSLGIQVVDWKTAFETQCEQTVATQKQLDIASATILDDRSKHLLDLQKISTDNETLSKGYSNLVAKKDEHIAQLNSKIRDLEELNAKKPKGQKLTGPRERESLLKFILGMAIRGYSYDPKATRSSEIRKIAGDLQLAGLALDEDTVRKYLNEAKALYADALTEQKG